MIVVSTEFPLIILFLGMYSGDWHNHPFLLLFKTEDKEELPQEVKSQWSAQTGFNPQHSKSYIMI